MENRFNLDKYVGRWYEIARSPAPYQKYCGGAIAEYKKIDDSTIKITNYCLKAGAVEYSSVGMAYATDEDSVFLAKFNDNESSYIVLYTDYVKYSLVTTDSGTVWILSRTPYVNLEDLRGLIDILSEMGISVSNITTSNSDYRKNHKK